MRGSDAPARLLHPEDDLSMDASHSLWLVVLAVIGVVITLFVMNIATPFLNLAAADKAGQGTREIYNIAVDQIRQLESGKIVEGTIPHAWVQGDMLLVGFSPSANIIEDKCQEKPLLRPLSRCPLGKACVCLCVASRGCDDAAIPSCTPLERTKGFTLKGVPEANALGASQPDGKDFLIYGDCGMLYRSMTPTTLYVYFDDDAATHMVVSATPPESGIAKLAKQPAQAAPIATT